MKVVPFLIFKDSFFMRKRDGAIHLATLYEAICVNTMIVDPGSPVVIILATGFDVRRFKNGQGKWIFSERKSPEYDLLWKGSKAVGHVRRFTARKRTSSRIRASEQNLSNVSRSL